MKGARREIPWVIRDGGGAIRARVVLDDRDSNRSGELLQIGGERLAGLDHHRDEVAGDIGRKIHDLIGSRPLHDETGQVGTRSEIGPFVKPPNLESDLVHTQLS